MALNDDALRSNLAVAADEHTAESIAKLDKAETIFYVAHVLGVELEESHPSEHNGNMTRGTVAEVAQALGDYVRDGAIDPAGEGDN